MNNYSENLDIITACLRKWGRLLAAEGGINEIEILSFVPVPDFGGVQRLLANSPG
jgi:hypothetical protein